MAHSLTITEAEWGSRTDGVLWLVRPGRHLADAGYMPAHQMPLNPRPTVLPPAEFVEATRECSYVTFPDDTWPAKCDRGRVVNIMVGYDGGPCPACRIELWADRCILNKVSGACRSDCGHQDHMIIGSAYAASGVLPIVVDPDSVGTAACLAADEGEIWYWQDGEAGEYSEWEVTDTLAHYGDPSKLVGQYAIRLSV